jgi:SAM-dependent methyltransferase
MPALAAVSATPDPMIPDPTIPTRFTVMGGTLPAGRVTPHMAGLHSALFGLVPRRERLAAAARGVVLELGGGLNVPYYRDVDRVVVVEPDVRRHAALLDRVAASAVAVEVHESDVDESAFSQATFDTVVCAFTLCAVADPPDTLRLIHRLLRPEGKLLFLEHVRSGGVRGTIQQLSGPIWPRLFHGCHPDRDTVAAIRDAGFLVTDLDRFSIRLAAPVVRPAVRGVAKIAA